MFDAVLHGKVPSALLGLEDVLTSNVFGTLRREHPSDGLARFLETAYREESGKREMLSRVLGDIESASYEFWPPLSETDCIFAEPDVVVITQDAGKRKSAVLVEAKLYSGKSSGPGTGLRPRDQLAREYDNLVRWALRLHAIPAERCHLVYCTAGIGPPTEEMRQAEDEYKKKRKAELHVYWMTWRVLPRLLQGSSRPLLRELAEVVKRMGLVFYEGVTPFPEAVPGPTDLWSFRKGDIGHGWRPVPGLPQPWTFSRVV